MSVAIVNYPEKVLHLPPRSWHLQGAIHFKEDDVRVKRSRFRLVILSAAKDLARRTQRSFAALRMTGLISKCLSQSQAH